MTDITEPSFEDAYRQLEDLVMRLESNDLTLEESVSLYERGQQLHARCQSLLDKAEFRIQQLNEDGTLTSFDAS